MSSRVIRLAAAAVALGLVAGQALAMPLMQWPDLMSRPRPKADARTFYGTDPNQWGEWRSPKGAGRHPLVVMIHGGCWEAAVADAGIMDWAAEDLRGRGYVVFNIEYRRLGQVGAGYPGTYLDVAEAIAFARREAPRHGADPERVILLGHSAGGHLALWAAGRGRIPVSSPLHEAHPGRLLGVVALGAITDLKADVTACGEAVTARMAGEVSSARPDPFADTSPYVLAPLGVRTLLITGLEDVTVPLTIARRYGEHAQALGDRVEIHTPPGGHVEEIAPGSAAWTAAVAAVESVAR
jgi:acetyl esterase/lipase